MNITSRRDTLRKIYSPFGWVFAKANISPNAITLMAAFLGTIAALMYYIGHPVIGAFLFFSSGVLDLCDGYVATVNRQATRFGAVFDWISDKWVDGVVLGAVGLRYANGFVAIIAVVVSMLHTFVKPVAYAEIGYEDRIKGKIVDPIEGTGFFGRPETFIVLFVSSVIYPFRNSALTVGIVVITIATVLSLFHRIYYLYKVYGGDFEE